MNTIRFLSLVAAVAGTAYMLVYPVVVATVCTSALETFDPGCAARPHPLVSMFAFGVAMGCAIIAAASSKKM